MQDDFVNIECPVEKINGRFVLRIPLAWGGDKLIECSRSFSEIREQFLWIIVSQSVAEMLRLKEGDRVYVGNPNGEFHLRLVDL